MRSVRGIKMHLNTFAAVCLLSLCMLACGGNSDGDGTNVSLVHTGGPAQCSDGVDNDGDGLVDEADSDCSGPMDTSESHEDTADAGMGNGSGSGDGGSRDGTLGQGSGLSCGDTPDGAQAQRTRFEADSVAYGDTCQPEVQTCTCTDGSWTDCTGAFTETECSVACPEGASRIGGTPDAPDCQCESGFTIVDGQCTARCNQENQRFDAASNNCVCVDEHFLVDGACVHGEDLCPENSRYTPGPDGANECTCNEGLVLNFDGDACVQPGQECPEGRPRMIMNDVLILCCPENALSVLYSGGMASCRCEAGQSYNPVDNTCS